MWYEIKQVLGRGGFAVTYLALDTHLQQLVAIKEYLPGGLAQRSSADVAPKPGSEANFTWGRERFLAEARTLARFKHPNIVRVVSFFEANNTAYLVMDFEEGQSLAQALALNPAIDEAALMRLLLPLMDGLALLHKEGFIHRDIKPDNIYLRRDGSPVLLDFGSARQALGNHTQNLTSLLSPGYAPLEQYFSQKDRQGAWSDIYALGAVMYRVVSGQKPPEASLRSNYLINGMEDPLKPARLAGLGRYSTQLLDAIDLSLRLRENERPQSLSEWRQRLPGVAAGAWQEAPTVAQSPRPMPSSSSATTLRDGTTQRTTAAAADIAGGTAPRPATRAATVRSQAREESSGGGRKFLYLLLVAAALAVAATKPWRSPERPATPVVEPREETLAPPREERPAPPPDIRDEPPAHRLPPEPIGAAPATYPEQRPEPRPEFRPESPRIAPAYPEAAPNPNRETFRPPQGEFRPPYGEPDRPRLGDGRRGEQLDPSMQACRDDAERHCTGIMPGDGRLAACMRENMHLFTPDCRMLVQERFRGPPRRPGPGER